MQIKDQNTDFETRSLDTVCVNESERTQWHHNIKYLVVGVLFGILFIKAEVISWYAFRKCSVSSLFHMYGLIGSAVLVELYPFFIKNSTLIPSMAKRLNFMTKS
jgi:hypothetical protein